MFVHAKVQEPAAKTVRIAVWLAITALVTFALIAVSARANQVFAAETLNQTIPAGGIVPSNDAEECGDVDLDAGQVLWHFVLTQTTAGTGTILHVTFSDGSSQNVGATRKTGGTLHWYVYTGNVNLTGASTTATGGNLNLSHVCVGEGSSSSSSSSTTS